MKADALAVLSERGIFTTLTMTAALGVNDGEIGDVLQVALDTPYVGGVSIQPQFGSGRSGAIDPMNRLTHTGVLARLGPQTGGRVTWRDLTALPCSHPHCCSVGYLIKDDAGEWRSLVSLVGADRLREHLDLVEQPDRRPGDPAAGAVRRQGVAARAAVRAVLAVAPAGRRPVARCVRVVRPRVSPRCCGSALPGRAKALRRMLGERVVRVTVKPFMDMSTMLEERLTQCCVHVGHPLADAGPVRAVLRGPGLAAARSAADVGGCRPPVAAARGGHVTAAPLADEGAATTYDPLRLCVFTTVALLTWVLGPAVVVAFAALGFTGYLRARRAGLTRSKCVLRDTPAGAGLPGAGGPERPGRGRLAAARAGHLTELRPVDRRRDRTSVRTDHGAPTEGRSTWRST